MNEPEWSLSMNRTDLIKRIETLSGEHDQRYKQSEELQDIGKSAMSSIADMVAALDCDYDRLEDLRAMKLEYGERNTDPEYMPWHEASREEADELAELEAAAGDCKDREEAEQRIREDVLSVQVHSGWCSLGEDLKPEEFELLLGTGGPAVRILGELDYSGEPSRARLQAQDWFKPWTDYVGADGDTLLSYCRCFYFGEG